MVIKMNALSCSIQRFQILIFIIELTKKMSQQAILQEEQRKRLDRQRFIGIQTQKRLLTFRVLISPSNGITTQLSKNLILSGVNLSIYDNQIISSDDYQSNFLIATNQIGQKRGECVFARLKQMNPSGKSIWIDEDINKKVQHQGEEFLKDFTIVVTSFTNFQIVKKWDQICSRLNKPYYNMVGSGLYAYSYISLGNSYQYKELAKKDKDLLKVWNLQSLTFDQCLETQNLNKSKEATFLTAIMMMVKAQSQNIVYSPFLESKDETKILENQKNLQKIVQLGFQMRPNNQKHLQFYKKFASCHGLDYCPVYSVIGSIISQEIIKIAENQFQPGVNWLFYDSEDGFASVFKLKSQQQFIKANVVQLEK